VRAAVYIRCGRTHRERVAKGGGAIDHHVHHSRQRPNRWLRFLGPFAEHQPADRDARWSGGVAAQPRGDCRERAAGGAGWLVLISSVADRCGTWNKGCACRAEPIGARVLAATSLATASSRAAPRCVG